MPHTKETPEVEHHIEEVLDKWDTVKKEVGEKIQLGRLETDHLKLLDNIGERLVEASNTSSRYRGDIDAACTESENLRQRVRRRLLHKGTASEIPIRNIIGA